uniref:Dolichol-phosphate mannosyltransferase n=1 Tax=Candidatus Kentrum sp. LPFa TaxID=2126335 RepID=A0A450XDE0_9GAMM|nr:MAG: dolichol-phosphate mannosyltransferase [Candidatus Kentron sp. LPFa]VFK27313.1 MAG: dolichol-phosphate mannosyltransferase [Candidatus Kentron sp. LPFa]
MPKTSMHPHISVVSPVYGKELDLGELCHRLVQSLSQLTDAFEIILVNDGSPDDAWEVIQSLAWEEPRIRGINLSRNFGQHYAITAGLDYVRGDWCVVMDCDLQDRPEEIGKLYEKAQEGYDIVVGRRANRQDSAWTRLTSKLFYMVFNYLTDQKISNTIANFGIYSRPVIDAVLQYKEHDRSFGLLVSLVGYKRAEIDVVHASREIGSSAYSFRMRLHMAKDHILSHSTKPLGLVVKFGLIITLFSFLYAFFLMVRYLFLSASVPGWHGLMVSMFFLSGIIISLIGTVGLYVGKIIDEVKERPLFIVESTTFGDNG